MRKKKSMAMILDVSSRRWTWRIFHSVYQAIDYNESMAAKRLQKSITKIMTAARRQIKDKNCPWLEKSA